jgi:peptidoglycan/xylan/chitin deacetylase (PgdA/CDA1 family)
MCIVLCASCSPFQTKYDRSSIDSVISTQKRSETDNTSAQTQPSPASAQITTIIKAKHKKVFICDDAKRVALTFDDGPHKNTMAILNILHKYGAKATFFVLGQNVSAHTNTVRAMVAHGHEIGNHSWDHPDITQLSQNQIREQVRRTQEIIYQATGTAPTLFRPPYGSYTATDQQVLPMPLVLWTIDTLDWKNRDAHQTTSKVLASIRNCSVILLHDIHRSTIHATQMILDHLSKRNITFVTMTELRKFCGLSSVVLN